MLEIDLDTHCGEAFHMLIDGAQADRAAARKRHPRLAATRDEGPQRKDRRAHRLDELVGRKRPIDTRGVERKGCRRRRLVRDAHLSGQPNAPKLEIFVEPVDTLRYTASASKAGGLLGRSDRSLHIELPKVARTTYRDAYTAVLADFLTQGADLPASARAK